MGIVAPTAVDAFNAESLTHRNFSVTADIDTYAGLQENVAATDVVELATVSVAVRDQADSDGTNDATPSAALTVEAVDDPYEGTGTDPDNFTVAFTADEGRLCVAEDMDDCDDGDAATDDDETETELELEVTAGGPGALSDPFERVDFWVRDVNGASWMLGSDTSGESGRQGGTGAEGGADDPRNRTWTYSLDATAANLYMLTREAAFTPTTDSDTHTVLAFGVNDDGIALVSSLTLDIDDGESWSVTLRLRSFQLAGTREGPAERPGPLGFFVSRLSLLSELTVSSGQTQSRTGLLQARVPVARPDLKEAGGATQFRQRGTEHQTQVAAAQTLRRQKTSPT